MKSRLSRRWVFTCSIREVLLEILEQPGIDFGKEIIPKAISTHTVSPYIFRGYWADIGTIDSFYEANIQLTRRGAPFNFFHPRWPIYTHPRFLPATRVFNSQLESSIVAEGCYLDRCTLESSVVGIRTRISPSAKITRSVLLGADFYEEDTSANSIPLGIGRDVVMDRVIVDKNARIGDGVRLVNERWSAGGRRRRLLHPQRHHHRAEGSARRRGRHRLATQAQPL